MIGFNVKQSNFHTVEANWQTANETNFSHLNIQRSTDGLYFATIATLASKGYMNKSTSYAYFDSVRPDALVRYYRLVMNDKNGTIRFIDVISIKESDNHSFSIVPNPVIDFVYVRTMLLEGTKTVIEIVDMLGNVVLRNPVAINTNKVEISVRSLSTSTYYLKLKTL